MSLWVGIIGIVAVLAFATVMALSEMRRYGYLRERLPRITRDQAREIEIAARLEAEGYTPDEVAYALGSDIGPEIVPLVARSRPFHHTGEMPTLNLRVRATSLPRLEDSARRAVARALAIDPIDVVIDLRQIEVRR